MKNVSPTLTAVQYYQLGEIESSVQRLFHERARAPGALHRFCAARFQNQWLHIRAIEERMTPQAAELMGHLLEEMVAMVVSGQECHIPVLQSFDGVYLQDGTVLTLPNELRDHWHGSGKTGGEAGLRVQLRINWSDGKLTGRLPARCPCQRKYWGGDPRKHSTAPREHCMSPTAAT